MNLKMLAAALALALVQGAAVAAPVFTDDFSIPSPVVQDVTNDSTPVWGTPVHLGSGIYRTIGVYRDSGSGNFVSAEVSDGMFQSTQGGVGTTGQVAIFYSGSGLNALPNPFTGAVTFSLLGNEVEPVTVGLFGGVYGSPPSSGGTLFDVQTVTTTGSMPVSPYPLLLSLFGIGDFGGGVLNDPNGFAIVFQNETVFSLDFIIDDLALVPAPATLSILGLGLLGVAGFIRRKPFA